MHRRRLPSPVPSTRLVGVPPDHLADASPVMSGAATVTNTLSMAAVPPTSSKAHQGAGGEFGGPSARCNGQHGPACRSSPAVGSGQGEACRKQRRFLNGSTSACLTRQIRPAPRAGDFMPASSPLAGFSFRAGRRCQAKLAVDRHRWPSRCRYQVRDRRKQNAARAASAL